MRKPRSSTVRIAFTKQSLAALKPSAKRRYYVFDKRTPSLALMVTPTNAKTFYVVRRVDRRPQRLRVGSLADLSVEQARREAARLNGEIALGRDPAEQRRLIRKRATLGDVFDHYRSTHLEPHCNPRSVKEDGRRFDKHLGCWRNRPLVTLRVEEIAMLHTALGRKTPIEANRVMELLRRVFNHGRHQFEIDKPNPTEGIKRFRETSRERFLEPTEIKQFFAALNSDPDLDLQDFIKLLLVTGVRKGNLERARWSDLDLDRGLWRIPASESKNGEPMVVVLPIPAVDILRSRLSSAEGLPLSAGGLGGKAPSATEGYVFRNAAGRLPGVKRGWERIRAASGLADLHLHDLRRTLGSWQAALGTSLLIIGKSLGHKSYEATQVYSRLNLDAVRASVEAASRALLTAGGILPAAPVVAEQGGHNGK